jgi:phosphatidylinositol dimannoside acyltransferase
MGEGRAKLTYLAYRSLGTAMARVPEPVANAAASVVVEVMARRPGRPREMAERHIRRLLSSTSSVVAPDDALVRRWARRSFRSYGRYWVEGARLPSTSSAEVRARFNIEMGYEHLKAAMASGRGVVMALPHIGSWEWGGAFLALDGYPMTSVAEQVEPPELFDWFIEQRQAMGLTIVPLGPRSGGELLQTLRTGGLVGLLCDRDLVGNGVEVEFFGERTRLPPGPATLALRTGAVLLAGVVYTGPGRYHVAMISPPLPAERTGSLRKDVTRVTQGIARQLEAYIRFAPEQWHLFQPNWPSDSPGVQAPGQPGD